MEDGLADAKITPGVLKRVFGHFPRHLKSTVPGTFTFEDFVFFYLADKDRMTDTSVLYWFRCLDIDGDGFLGKSDLETCYEMKVRRLSCMCSRVVVLCSAISCVVLLCPHSSRRFVKLARQTPWGPSLPLTRCVKSLTSSILRFRGGYGCRHTNPIALSRCVAYVVELPVQITCMDITRSNSGPVVFDVLITVAGGPASVNYLV